MSNLKKANHVIQPSRFCVGGIPILGFETEEELNLYTVWHEALVDKRRESNAQSERERQLIRNEINRKARLLTGSSSVQSTRVPAGPTQNGPSKSKSSSSSKSRRRPAAAPKPAPQPPPPPAAAASPSHSHSSSKSSTSPLKTSTSSNTSAAALAASRRVVAAAAAFRSPRPSAAHQSAVVAAAQSAASRQRQGSASLPNGLTILNSSHYNTLPSGKQLMKYKLTKLYNKYRGRQLRRNFVIEKQRNAKIEIEISKSYLNSWLAYTALQALRLPESNITSLSTTTINNGKFLTPMAAPSAAVPVQQQSVASFVAGAANVNVAPVGAAKKIKSSSPKKQQPIKNAQTPQLPQNAPMHLVYIDPGNIITYSNKINPQQVADYRQKSHLLPSSATSKKSSAASYDVYEIMEVLANTNKTNVTITRNANRAPSQAGSQSIYSHSVNANTPGIVSTQLHLQARAYLDSMSKFYAEEAQRLAKEREEMESVRSDEEVISRYLYL